MEETAPAPQGDELAQDLADNARYFEQVQKEERAKMVAAFEDKDDSAALQARIATLESQVNALELDRDDWKATAQNANTLIDIQRTAEKKAFALEAENARFRTGLSRLVAHMDKELRFTKGWHDYNKARNMANDILVVIDSVTTTPTPSAPATPNRPISARVNWSRGFSGQAYPVIAFSQSKGTLVLNISSDDNRVMPKTVRVADCAVQYA
jgi:hypothetical protein